MKLFEHIEDLADDSSCMVTILIDEVESLVSSRDKMAADPGDATRYATLSWIRLLELIQHRSVNAMLTSLDALRHRSNIMLLCTSNLIGGIDEVKVIV